MLPLFLKRAAKVRIFFYPPNFSATFLQKFLNFFSPKVYIIDYQRNKYILLFYIAHNQYFRLRQHIYSKHAVLANALTY